MAGKLPNPGRISLSPMLSYRGKLCGDLTVSCIDENEFMVLVQVQLKKCIDVGLKAI